MNTYEYFVHKAQDLVNRAGEQPDQILFENFIEELANLRRELVARYTEMTVTKRRDIATLLDTTKSFLRDKHDVFRVREMRSVLQKEA